jgi:hypothetical protein
MAALAACGDTATAPSALEPAPPASAALADVLPRPAADVPFRVTAGAAFALRPSATTQGALPAGTRSYDLMSLQSEALGGEVQSWRFGVDESGLRATLGDAEVDAGRARVADALGPLLARPEVRQGLAAAVAAQPSLQAIDLAGAWATEDLAIETLSLADGLFVDAEGDGVLETSRSALMLRVRLPAAAVETPPAPLPACDALLGDGSAPAARAAQEGLSYLRPADATWDRRIDLTVHVTLEDLAPAHAALWSPTSYVSSGERAAAAHDLAVFRRFLQDPAAHLVGAELSIALAPEEPLVQQTLAIVAALASAAGDVACLRQVDGWLAEPTILLSPLDAVHLAGTAAPPFMVQAYDAQLDALDGVTDPGLVCLHDGGGDVVVVGSQELACATPSGPLMLVVAAASDGAPPAAVFTPYERLASRSAGGLTAAFARCDAKPWSDMCTARFGRGIRLCMGDWAIRDQVGDYWNIHWTQSAKKAAAQVAIKAGGYILRGVVTFYMGSGAVLPRLMVAIASEGSAYLGDVVSHLTGSKVAGYSIHGYGAYVAFVWERAFMNWDLIKSSATFVESFVADRVVDGLAQMLEVTAVGWQDYSDGSRGMCGFESH